MDDYQRMDKFLRSLNRDEFIEFWEIHGHKAPTFGPKQTQNILGGIDVCVFEPWRAEKTELILSWRHNDPVLWDRYCLQAGIDTDSAATQKLAGRQSKWAIRLAIASIALSAAVTGWTIWKDVTETQAPGQSQSPTSDETDSGNEKRDAPD